MTADIFEQRMGPTANRHPLAVPEIGVAAASLVRNVP
jgi:hypothetical protein